MSAVYYTVCVHRDHFDAPDKYMTTQLGNLVDILSGPVSDDINNGATALLTIDDGERDITVEVLP